MVIDYYLVSLHDTSLKKLTACFYLFPLLTKRKTRNAAITSAAAPSRDAAASRLDVRCSVEGSSLSQEHGCWRRWGGRAPHGSNAEPSSSSAYPGPDAAADPKDKNEPQLSLQLWAAVPNAPQAHAGSSVPTSAKRTSLSLVIAHPSFFPLLREKKRLCSSFLFLFPFYIPLDTP